MKLLYKRFSLKVGDMLSFLAWILKGSSSRRRLSLALLTLFQLAETFPKGNMWDSYVEKAWQLSLNGHYLYILSRNSPVCFLHWSLIYSETLYWPNWGQLFIRSPFILTGESITALMSCRHVLGSMSKESCVIWLAHVLTATMSGQMFWGLIRPVQTGHITFHRVCFFVSFFSVHQCPNTPTPKHHIIYMCIYAL